MQFDACVLNVNTQIFSCGPDTVSPGNWLPAAGGGIGDYYGDTGSDDGDHDVIVSDAGGGNHLWDPIVSGLVAFVNDYVYDRLPEHDTVGLATYASNAINEIMPVLMLVKSTGFINLFPFFLILGLIFVEKLVYIAVVLWRWILRMIPAAG